MHGIGPLLGYVYILNNVCQLFSALNVHEILRFLQDPHVLPQFPYTTHEVDVLSVTTEVEYLYKEKRRSLLSHDSLSSLINSMKNDEKAIDSPKLIMDRFLNGCHQRVWESSHESLSNAPSPLLQKDGKLSPCEEVAKLDAAKVEAGNSVSSDPHLNSDSNDIMAQHYTIPLPTSGLPNASGQQTDHDSYIPSGSSGYGTCSDHYFESGSSAYTGPANDYFKSRLADVAECNSLSTCGEEEGHQTTVDIMKHSKDTSLQHSQSGCCVNSNLENTAAFRSKNSPSKPSRPHFMTFPVKSTGRSKYDDDITTACTDHINHNELQNRCSSLSDYTQSPIPPEHYFTDDEGYLRFSKETAV